MFVCCFFGVEFKIKRSKKKSGSPSRWELVAVAAIAVVALAAFFWANGSVDSVAVEVGDGKNAISSAKVSIAYFDLTGFNILETKNVGLDGKTQFSRDKIALVEVKNKPSGTAIFQVVYSGGVVTMNISGASSANKVVFVLTSPFEGQ